MIHIFQIKQKTNINILQIVHVLITNILWKNNVDKDEDKYNENKEDNSESPKIDESLINKTEVEKVVTDCLMKINFPIKFIQYVVGTIISCEKNMIELVK